MHQSSAHSRNPVLLVHGLWDTGKIFQRMSIELKDLGWVVYDLDLIPSNGDACLDELAAQLSRFIEQTFEPAQSIDLVGFSMGGIISRYYLQRMNGLARVDRFITIASPHHGTWTAFSSLRPGCVQMRPNSAFLQDLNSDQELLNTINFTSIWTPLDAMIVPATSSLMPVGENVKIWVPTHRHMVFDSRSLVAVVRALSEPLRHPASDRPVGSSSSNNSHSNNTVSTSTASSTAPTA